jgi:hypothetical protein
MNETNPIAPLAEPAQPTCKYCELPIRETKMPVTRNEWEHMNGLSFCADNEHWAWPTAEPAQGEPKMIDVYEVYGSCAGGRGWDFLVCTTMKDALEQIEVSLDSLEESEEVKIVFRRYTPAQMEEVVYED